MKKQPLKKKKKYYIILKGQISRAFGNGCKIRRGNNRWKIKYLMRNPLRGLLAGVVALVWIRINLLLLNSKNKPRNLKV